MGRSNQDVAGPFGPNGRTGPRPVPGPRRHDERRLVDLFPELRAFLEPAWKRPPVNKGVSVLWSYLRRLTREGPKGWRQANGRARRP